MVAVETGSVTSLFNNGAGEVTLALLLCKILILRGTLIYRAAMAGDSGDIVAGVCALLYCKSCSLSYYKSFGVLRVSAGIWSCMLAIVGSDSDSDSDMDGGGEEL